MEDRDDNKVECKNINGDKYTLIQMLIEEQSYNHYYRDVQKVYKF